MNCTICSEPLPENTHFCPKCGAATAVAVPAGGWPSVPSSGSGWGGPPAPTWTEPPAVSPLERPPDAGTGPQLGTLSAFEAMLQPTRDPQFGQRIGIAALIGLVTLVPLLGSLIDSMLIIGFSVVYLSTMMRRRTFQPLPAWDNWQLIMLQGAKGWLIQMFYSAPSFVIGVAALWQPIAQLISSGGEAMPTPTVIQEALGLLGLAALFALVLGAFIPIGTLFFAQNDQLGRGFAIGDIVGFLFSHLGEFLVLALLTFGLGCVLFTVVVVVVIIPIVNLLAGVVGSIASFILAVCYYAGLANLWAKATPKAA